MSTGSEARGANRGATEQANEQSRGKRRWLTPVRATVALGLLALMIAAFATLAQSAPRRSGTDLTADTGFVIPLAAGEQLCQPGELVPGHTGGLRLDASSGAVAGPRLQAAMSVGDRRLASGALAAGWRTGAITIPISRVAETTQGVTVCVVNRGPGKVSFGGSVPDANFYVVLGAKPLSGRMRIDYMRLGSESWLQLLPALTHRFSLAKGDLVRHWAAPAALLLMLAAVALAARMILREEPRR